MEIQEGSDRYMSTYPHHKPLGSYNYPSVASGVISRTPVCTCFHINKATAKCPLQAVAKGSPDFCIAFGNENVIIHLYQFVKVLTPLYLASTRMSTEYIAAAAYRLICQYSSRANIKSLETNDQCFNVHGLKLQDYKLILASATGPNLSCSVKRDGPVVPTHCRPYTFKSASTVVVL